MGVVQSDGKVELRNVRLGRDFGQTVEIIDDITTNDLVIQNPADSPTSGIVVESIGCPSARTWIASDIQKSLNDVSAQVNSFRGIDVAKSPAYSLPSVRLASGANASENAGEASLAVASRSPEPSSSDQASSSPGR